ncbi:hypothetical protein Bca4012_059560 [Brassica carinata]
MAPSRTSKSVYKRSTKEASPEKESRNSSKTKQRSKRLTDKLGPHWTKGELERFYYAYRKHGRDWKRVAAAVRNSRSVDMVEALFNMNRAYLSLPEGTASVAGLIAMMTDHYSVIEESESEEEGHGASVVSMKNQKRKLAKPSSSDFREEVYPPHSVASAEGCLSFLKLTRTYGMERRAAGKRTPRFPVPSEYQSDDREVPMPPNKRAKKQLEADDDDTLALALANAARRGVGSPHRRTQVNGNTPNGKMSQAKEAQSKHRASSMVGNVVRISRDRRHIKGAPDRDGALLMDAKGVGTLEVAQKKENVRFEEAEGDASDDSGEACNANEGLKSGDELEALQALAELSALLSTDGLKESESYPQLKEDRRANNMDEKPHTPETVVRSYHRRKSKQVGPEDRLLPAISAAGASKPKPAQEIVDGNAVSIGELGTSKRKRKTLHNKESAEDDNLKTLIKARRADQSPPKQLKTAKTSEESCSTSVRKITRPDAVVSATQVSGSGPAQRPPNRRKMSLKKSLQERARSSETTFEKPHRYEINSKHELLKEQVSTCLSHPLVRRRCIFEWFYSAIDYPWFAKMEFIDFLNHLGIGPAPRLTRLEWSVIKSSLGRTRRFSEKFIQEERDKLKQYRESARKHYTEIRAGAREVLPRDFAQPLSVGNRVTAIHPKTREIRDGKILTVDHNKCNVMFDDMGVDLVMDIDIMPLNPLEYMPDGLRRQIDNCLSVTKEAELNRLPRSDASALFPPPVLENIDFSMIPPTKQDDKDRRVATDQTHNTASNNARQAENQRALMLEHTSDEEAASLVKDDKCAGNVVLQALDSMGEHHQPLDDAIVFGDFRAYRLLSFNLAHDSEKKYPPADVAQVMEIAAERYKAANQRAVQLLEKCGTTQVEVDASGSLTYPTEKCDAGGDQGDKKLKPLSVDEERFMRAFYEAKVQEVCSAFEFPHKIQSLEFDLIVFAPYRAIEGFVSNMEEFLQARDDEIQKLESLLKAATAEADKIMLTDAPLLFPPGQLALAALRIANGVLGVVDFDRYLENIVSQPNSEHTTSELIKLLDEIEYLVRNYKYPSEKDMKHINRKLKSCLGHSSSHDESKKREKRSKHKSHRNSSDTPKGPPIG